MASFFDNLLKRKNVTIGMPDQFRSQYEQALSAAAAQDFERALQLYDHAIAIDPAHAEAHYKRGNTLKSLGRLHAAIESYDQAIKLKPDYAYAYCNRGVVQRDLGFLDQALSSYDLALEYDALDARSHYNRALLLQERLRWAEALESYDRAIAADPGFADAHYNRSLTLLYCGDLERGWPGYEWRWKNASRLGLGAERAFAQPLWLGEQSLVGKRVLLHAEGGLGDTLQFCRYAPVVAKLGATVYLEVPRPLVALLVDLEGVSQLIATGSPLPDFDYHCPLMSLPLAFETTLDSIPAAQKYLHAEEDKVRHWAERLETLPRPWVGLAWSGNPNNPIDQIRSMRLTELMEHLPAQVQYFRLQNSVRPEDQAALDAHPNIYPIDDEQLDFVSAAALAECMDIVISVDTSVAHLSAALGKRTWIMLPFVADWRWLRDRDDSPWYPSAKLYRQTLPGDWGPVLDRIAGDLRREFRIE
jgi:TPR repeat/Glycosyltransferase family 9 (heptosyltransferase)/Tetratricopeptide repeat